MGKVFFSSKLKKVKIYLKNNLDRLVDRFNELCIYSIYITQEITFYKIEGKIDRYNGHCIYSIYIKQ